MRYAYVTKRPAPVGYVSVTRPLAELLYTEGKTVTLCGNTVTHFHVFGGWMLGYTINTSENSGRSFQDIVSQCFMRYLAPQLGKYPVFYVKETDVLSQ